MATAPPRITRQKLLIRSGWTETAIERFLPVRAKQDESKPLEKPKSSATFGLSRVTEVEASDVWSTWLDELMLERRRAVGLPDTVEEEYRRIPEIHAKVRRDISRKPPR